MTEELTQEYQLAHETTLRQLKGFMDAYGTEGLADVGGAGYRSRLAVFGWYPDTYDVSLDELEGEGTVHDICLEPLPKKYDTVICCNTFEHIIDPFGAARNIMDSMEPGGHLFLTTVWKYPFHAYREVMDTYRYTHQALSGLFRGLEEIRCWYETETHPEGAERVTYVGKKPS